MSGEQRPGGLAASLRTGGTAGVLAACALGVLELATGLPETLASGAPWYGLALVPLMDLLLLLPLVVLIGAAASALLWAWLGQGPEELAGRLRSSWGELEGGSLAWHGWMIGALLVAGGAVAAGGLAGKQLEGEVNSALFRGILIVVAALAVALVWGALVRVGSRGAARAVTALRRAGRLERLTGGRTLLGLLLAGVLLVGGAGAWRVRGTLADIGWSNVIWALAVPGALILGWLVALRFHARLSWRLRWLALIVVASFVCTVLLGEIAGVRQGIFAAEGSSAVLISVYQRLLDFDGDGRASFYGGGDCAPFDARIGPNVGEIPGNGVDENCDGRDVAEGLTLNDKAFVPPPREHVPEPPDILLITVDALRADHMGLYGYERPTTPEIDRHAAKGVVFERNYAQSSGTIGSLPSVFAGKQPTQILYDDEGKSPRPISAKETLLAERLVTAGYSTQCISTIRYTHRRAWRLLQGCDEVDLDFTQPDPAFKVTSDAVYEKAVEALRAHRDDSRPHFLWVHFYDVHTEYLKHPDQRSFGNARRDIYDGEILYTDRYIGKLLDYVLGDTGNPRLVVLAADHGDGFRSDRGKINHGYGLWQEEIHTPLIVWAPGAAPRRVDTPVVNLDVAPTILSFAGVSAKSLTGWSLVPYLYEGFRDPERLAISVEPYRSSGTWQERSVAIGMRYVLHRWHHQGRESLFDLEADPKEKENVLDAHADIAATYGKAIESVVGRTAAELAAVEHLEGEDEPVVNDEPAPEPDWVVHARRVGGDGGNFDAWDCPEGQVIDALRVRVKPYGKKKKGKKNLMVSGVKPVCRHVGSGKPGASGDWYGGHRVKKDEALRCKGADVAIGLFGRSGSLVDSLGLVCEAAGPAGGGERATYRTESLGGPGGKPFEVRCPEGSVIAGWRSRSAWMLNAAGMACREAPEGLFAAGSAVPAATVRSLGHVRRGSSRLPLLPWSKAGRKPRSAATPEQ